MRKITVIVPVGFFLSALGFSLVGKQHSAFASHQCCTPQTCALIEIISGRIGNDFSVDYAYEWCHPDEPLIAWIEVDAVGSENIDIESLDYTPDYYFPEHCHGAFVATVEGSTEGSGPATLVSKGKSWNASPGCSDLESTNL